MGCDSLCSFVSSGAQRRAGGTCFKSCGGRYFKTGNACLIYMCVARAIIVWFHSALVLQSRCTRQESHWTNTGIWECEALRAYVWFAFAWALASCVLGIGMQDLEIVNLPITRDMTHISRKSQNQFYKRPTILKPCE
ncbi:hypothetical protein AAMO2058_001331200 [Amorphochlora amoebiformis]